MDKKIKVQTEESQRLDVYLSQFLGISRAKIQKLIKSEFVLVNEEIGKTKTLINNGDEIKVMYDTDVKKEPVKAPPMPDVIYEDNDVLVINKPSGLKVHPAHEEDSDPTLTHVLSIKYPEIKTVGDEPELRPGLVHRLDKYASGVLVVAKTQDAYDHLKNQFKNRAVKKIYSVLVYGCPSKEHDLIKLRLDRSKKGNIVAHPENSEKGRDAMSEYDIVEKFATTTLLKVQIHTGRTHQIRAHMFSIGHPVVGDMVYRQKQMKNINPIELHRLFLHASELTISLPSREQKTFVAELPKELSDTLASLSK